MTNEMTIAQVIGQNIRQRRDQLGMTAAELGEAVGAAFGKAWPRQTVYLMESGERAMVAAEVAVIAKVLGVPVPSLFEPTGRIKVTAGSMEIPAETLMRAAEPKLVRVSRGLGALAEANARLMDVAKEQAEFIGYVRDSLHGVGNGNPDVLPDSDAS